MKRKEVFRHDDGGDPLFSAAYTPDSKTIMTIGEDGVIHFWDVATRQEARQPLQYGDELDPFFPIAFSPDGKQGLVRTPSIPHSEIYFHAWDVPIWNATSEFSNFRTSLRIKGDFSSATFSPDGKQIATVVCVETRIESGFDRICTSPYVGIWEETPLQEVRQLHGHTDWIRSAAFSPDGQRIVTASYDRTARIWDVATGQELIKLSGHIDRVWSAAFSPDSQFIVTASKDRTARIWDANTGKVLQTLSGHSGTVLSAAFSPDGKYIVTASTDQTARVWDAATGQEVRTLNGHTDWVLSAIYRPDGQEILTVSADKTARTWSNIDNLLEEAKRLIQRDPPLLTPEERRKYGLE
jgi:WD40 repeat protein